MKISDSIKQFWGARTANERILLRVAGAVALALVLYVVLLEPALTARKRLSADLPVLRAQVDDMRREEKEIAVLRKKVSTASQHGDLKELLQASIGRTSFVKAIERIESHADGKVQLLAAPAIFDEWLGWVENLQREFGIRLETCKVTATDMPGMVRIEATFARSGQPVARKTP